MCPSFHHEHNVTNKLSVHSASAPIEYIQYLSGVHGSLYDVEDGDITALARARRHHDVLRLRQSARADIHSDNIEQ